MKTDICKRLGIDYPIFAFTHSRDVVAAVSQAGGLGVLGAVGFTVEQLRVELEWLDEHVGDKPYAVDLVIPQKYEGIGELDPEKLTDQLNEAVPAEHREFAEKLLREHGVPEWPDETTPDPLGMPLQGLVTIDAIRRTKRYASVADTAKVAFAPVGQVVGEIESEQSYRTVIFDLLSGYANAVERLNALLPDED